MLIKALLLASALSIPSITLASWEVDRTQCIARTFVDFQGTKGSVIYTELKDRAIFVVQIPEWRLPKFSGPLPITVFIDDAFVAEASPFRVHQDRVAFSITDTVRFKEAVNGGKLISFRVDDNLSLVEFTLGLASEAIRSTNLCVNRY